MLPVRRVFRRPVHPGAAENGLEGRPVAVVRRAAVRLLVLNGILAAPIHRGAADIVPGLDPVPDGRAVVGPEARRVGPEVAVLPEVLEAAVRLVLLAAFPANLPLQDAASRVRRAGLSAVAAKACQDADRLAALPLVLELLPVRQPELADGELLAARLLAALPVLTWRPPAQLARPA